MIKAMDLADYYEMTALMCAAQNGQAKTVEELIVQYPIQLNFWYILMQGIKINFNQRQVDNSK